MVAPQGKLEYQPQWLIVQQNIFTKSSTGEAFFPVSSPYIKLTENTDAKTIAQKKTDEQEHSYLRQSCLRMCALKNHSWMNI